MAPVPRYHKQNNEHQIQFPKDANAMGEPITLLVMNVDRSARAPDLEEHLRKFARLRRVRIVRDLQTGKSKGFAYVTFEHFPVDLFDQTNPHGYAEARLFMDRHLEFKAAPPDEQPSTEYTMNKIETFDCSLVQIGTIIQDDTLYVPHVIQDEEKIILRLQSHHRVVRWYLRSEDKDQDDYLMVADYALRDDYLSFEVDDEKNHWITVKLKNPPKIFRGKYEYIQETGLWEWTKEYEKIWHRAVGIARYPKVVFGDHVIYRFKLSPSEVEHGFLDMKLRDVAVFHGSRRNRDIFNSSPMKMTKEIPFVHVSLTYLQDFDFDLQYQLLVLISSSIITKWSITASFIALVNSTPIHVTKHLLDLFILENKPIYDVEKEFRRSLLRFSATPSLTGVKVKHCLQVRKTFITPTRIIFASPTIEIGNRVLRKYQHYADRFMRVAFTDENLQKLSGKSSLSDEILARMKNILMSGIKIADRKFEFLAFSSSQLREHSCWFFAPIQVKNGNLLTSEDIRRWMGNFDNITTVAKYAARLGQCFSSTTPFNVPEASVAEIPDIERDGYCFSDGVGKISKSLAESITADMGLTQVPSAFQVRMNGYKGVLSVDPNVSENDAQLQFRPSMRKFTTEAQTSLDIIRSSQYAPAYLNHQIISLLNSVFVEDEVFLELQRKMELELERISRDHRTAVKMLASYSTDSPGLNCALSMVDAKVRLDEPFISNVIHLFQCHKLKEAKHKARILVEDGVQLIGILDETDTLEYGQIFVQYTDPNSVNMSSPKVVMGTVLMTKMPAVHPGDIRVLTCVDSPALRHYVNVVVFPQRGPRPHTIEASGSDLDGDVYFVTWHQPLIPKFQNFDIQDYSAPKPLHVVKDINIDDVKNFMIEYIKGDSLGRIAVGHKVHADMHRKGVRSDTCVELARLHSLAVDFPKTGVPAGYDARRYHVTAYPDFLNLKGKPQYESTKALGKLYREIKTMSFKPNFDVKVDPLFLVDGYEEFVEEARILKAEYDFELRKLMRHHGVRSEFELVTQLFLDFEKKGFKKEFELRETLSAIIKRLVDTYTGKFWKGLEMENPKTKIWLDRVYDIRCMRKASAWYYVSYTTSEETPFAPSSAEKINDRVLFSMSWLCLSDVLLEIYSKNTHHKQTQEPRKSPVKIQYRPPRIDMERLKKRAVENNSSSTHSSSAQGIGMIGKFNVLNID